MSKKQLTVKVRSEITAAAEVVHDALTHYWNGNPHYQRMIEISRDMQRIVNTSLWTDVTTRADRVKTAAELMIQLYRTQSNAEQALFAETITSLLSMEVNNEER